MYGARDFDVPMLVSARPRNPPSFWGATLAAIWRAGAQHSYYLPINIKRLDCEIVESLTARNRGGSHV